MPNYDYHCNACNHEFTVDRSMSDTTAVNCETCNAGDTRRIWTAVSIGSGSAKGNKNSKEAAVQPKGGHGRCGPSCC